MKTRLPATLLLISMLLFSQSAFAASVWEMAQSDHYGKKVAGMLGRGLINIATCFVDLIVHTVEGTKQGPPFVGTMTGLGSGLGCTALRLTSGALDVVTFWVPSFNGIPVGRSYYNCVESDQMAGSNTGSGYYVDPNATPAAQQPMGIPQEEPRQATRHHDAMNYVKK